MRIIDNIKLNDKVAFHSLPDGAVFEWNDKITFIAMKVPAVDEQGNKNCVILQSGKFPIYRCMNGGDIVTHFPDAELKLNRK